MPQPIGIYIHVPFCRSKCPYCDFYSLRGGDEAMDAYTAALLRHIATAPTEKADSVYLGGGTPTFAGIPAAFPDFGGGGRPFPTL